MKTDKDFEINMLNLKDVLQGMDLEYPSQGDLEEVVSLASDCERILKAIYN